MLNIEVTRENGSILIKQDAVAISVHHDQLPAIIKWLQSEYSVNQNERGFVVHSEPRKKIGFEAWQERSEEKEK
jgi:hypothetical protein